MSFTKRCLAVVALIACCRGRQGLEIITVKVSPPGKFLLSVNATFLELTEEWP